jgi:hypothetical protein
MCHADAAESFSCREGVRISPAYHYVLRIPRDMGQLILSPASPQKPICASDNIVSTRSQSQRPGISAAIPIVQPRGRMCSHCDLRAMLERDIPSRTSDNSGSPPSLNPPLSCLGNSARYL